MNQTHLDIWLVTSRDFLGRAISGMQFEADPDLLVGMSCACADALLAEYEKRMAAAEVLRAEQREEDLLRRGVPNRSG